ncbi:MAG: transthyretin-like family protein [Gemmataceae bacterium]|nr:transthyretin-like family protein [Gemmataceae bacterium]
MPPCLTRRSLLLLGLSLALLASLSCSSGKRKLYPVRGKVLCDGKPAEDAIVTLHALDASQPMDQVPSGRVQADGSFALGTYEPEDGAPPGDYKVILIWLPPDALARISPTGRLPNRLPDLYSDAKTTPLTITVEEGPNDLPPYDLPSSGSPKGGRR